MHRRGEIGSSPVPTIGVVLLSSGAAVKQVTLYPMDRRTSMRRLLWLGRGLIGPSPVVTG